MGARTNIQKVTAVDMFIVQLMVEDSALDKYVKPRVSVLWYINIKRVLHYQLLENALGKTNLMSTNNKNAISKPKSYQNFKKIPIFYYVVFSK